MLLKLRAKPLILKMKGGYLVALPRLLGVWQFAARK